MPESRIEATDRLRKEGRWTEASLFRDTVRRQLRAQRMPRREANEQAWEQMLEKYPPLPDEDSDSEMSDYPWPEVPSTLPNLLAGVDWVYRSLNEQVGPADAPSSGSWGLFCWAKRSRRQFYTKFLPQVSAIRARQSHDDDAGNDFERLRNMMRT